MDKFDVLRRYFGYSSFRSGQQELTDCLLSGRDCVGIMPTGAGKSICFQVPALLKSGITVVVSPLISLMKDQVTSLIDCGVKAAYINSSLTPQQIGRVMDNAARGAYKIIYAAPERLETADFIGLAGSGLISMVCVDEAHCISQWGQDFRPSYLKIAQFIDRIYPRPVVGAFTATATENVKRDIISLLELKAPFELTTGFDRKNLYYDVREPSSKNTELLCIMDEIKDGSAIVYCSTRKSVEKVCELLIKNGFSAARYHAGLDDEERRANQEDFLFDRKQIMVATNAFGMGIDKSNVACVVHYNMPKDIESYYQEAGRAGRDGSQAKCILLFAASDIVTNNFLIDNFETEGIDEQEALRLKRIKRERLNSMIGYCRTTGCLREYILSYFGERAESRCDNCCNCLIGAEKADRTIEAQKIMSCIKRAGERFGVGMIIKILRGSRDERIISLGLDSLTTYGIMKQYGEQEIRTIIDGLIMLGLIKKSGDEYPILLLTESSGGVLFGGQRVLLKQHRIAGSRGGSAQRVIKNPSPDELTSQLDLSLFEQLKRLRLEIARSVGLPAFVVFNDASLRDMCVKKPLDEQEFLTVNGVGQNKLQRYGKRFIAEIRDFLGKNG